MLAHLVAACSSFLPALAGADPVPAKSQHSAAYDWPLAGLGATALTRFSAGKAEFAARWVPPFVSGGHWGRGPQSNADSCLACHPGNGRGRAPDGPGEEPHSLILRLAAAGADRLGRPRPHPAYGTQLNRYGTLGQLVEEGDFRIAYRSRQVTFADGGTIELRKPVVHFAALWFGPIGNDTIISPRLAQPVFGLGLLEAVSDSTLFALAERQRRIGFNGRPNLVRDDISGRQAVGRFGHKASQPNLRQQVAAAFHDEIGVTSRLYPHEQCPPIQPECRRVQSLSGVEAKDEQLEVITDYLQMLAPPAQRNSDDPLVRRGEWLFQKAHCAVCHVPVMKTGPGAAFGPLRNRTIRPYTDLLLHDMGVALADGRREFEAGERDWRTPPLWGIGLRTSVGSNAGLLHDGRARNIPEAILWHGGEADGSRRSFMNMSQQERSALVHFVESL